jgi:urease accessory protein
MLLYGVRFIVAAGLGLLLSTSAAWAHHLMGGKVPSTFVEGILSGLAHPIIGPSHFAFLLALGFAVGIAGLSYINLVLFLIAMASGVGYVAAADNAFSEAILVPLLLIVVVLLTLGRRVPRSAWLVLFVVAGFFHGDAYGDAIYGSEPTPLVAYLIGLVVVQTVLSVGVALAAHAVWSRLIARYATGQAAPPPNGANDRMRRALQRQWDEGPGLIWALVAIVILVALVASVIVLAITRW